MPIYQCHNFLMRQNWETLETLEEGQHPVALLDRPERQFLDHCTMTADLIVVEERNE